jgi:L-threonylcarbamoyladenylate synthase
VRREELRTALVTTDPQRAADALAAGGLAGVPTETVYGLAADAEQAAAVARVFEVKGRPPGHPLIVHIGSPADLHQWAIDIPPVAVALADALWPGPLTLLLARAAGVSDAITGGRLTVGIRVPAHPLAQRVLALTGGAFVAPSANRYGRVSPSTAEHVLDDLGELLDPARDVILDGGAATVGVESTIIDCTVTPPQILRPGGIPTERIIEVMTGAVGAAPGGRHDVLAPVTGASRAAGMVTSHYAPRADVHLVAAAAAAEATAVRLRAAGRRVRVIDGTADVARYARTLYAELRAADRDGCTDVVAVLPPAVGLGAAIRDRLQKAAATTVRAAR